MTPHFEIQQYAAYMILLWEKFAVMFYGHAFMCSYRIEAEIQLLQVPLLKTFFHSKSWNIEYWPNSRQNILPCNFLIALCNYRGVNDASVLDTVMVCSTITTCNSVTVVLVRSKALSICSNHFLSQSIWKMRTFCDVVLRRVVPCCISATSSNVSLNFTTAREIMKRLCRRP